MRFAPRSSGSTSTTGTSAIGARLSSRSPRPWACSTSPGGGRTRSCSKWAWAGGSTRPTWSTRYCPVITSIAFDHTRQLGNTLGAIATEKAGILKRSRPAVSGVLDDEPRQAIRRVAAQRRCPLRELGVDFRFEAIAPRQPVTRPTAGQVKSSTWRTDWGTLDVPLLGAHQAHNAAVALAGLDVLAELEPALEVGRDAVVRGLRRAALAGAGRGAGRVAAGWSSMAPTTSPRPQALAETLRTSFPATSGP